MTYETFCGGIFETNCYLLGAPDGWVLFDAPDGACDWLASQNVDLKLLLLTHGHFDHIPDVAKIKRLFKCQLPNRLPPPNRTNDFQSGILSQLRISTRNRAG